ncbi:MAG: CvpA family protein [Hyphomicrobiaceae bacterium]|nr:CvpA family protein [Hyphomicrobiaceae bacterium]
MSVTVLDAVVFVVVLASAVLAMMRGFLREVLSIGSWVAAAIAAYLFYPQLEPFAAQYLGEGIVARAAAIGGIFLVVLLVVSYITMRISDFVMDSKIGPLDRTLGFLFGAARGILLFVVAALFFDFFVPQNPPDWVANSRSKPFLDQLGEDLLAILPDDPQEQIIDRLRNAAEGTPEEETPADAPETDAAPETGYGDGERRGLDQLIDRSTTQ